MLPLAVLLLGCKPPPAAFVAPPPPEVTVEPPRLETAPDVLEFTGALRPSETVEIRARVRGFLKERHVAGGSVVNEGQLLFTIDPREYQAAVLRAEAQVGVMKARADFTEIELRRVQDLIARDAASRSEFDRVRTERDSAIAQVALAEAELAATRLNLEFTEIRAPITGRISIITIEPGQLVGAGDATLLAHVADEKRFYATYSLDEARLMRTRRAFQGRRPGEQGRDNLAVYMGLSDREDFPYVGQFTAADIGLNPQTGSITVEAIFENTDGLLLPGMYVRLRTPIGEQQVLTVPDVAVMRDQRGPHLLVVEAENKVGRRDVTPGQLLGRRRALLPDESGKFPLAEQERVIVNGLQRARPGMVVKPLTAEALAAATSKPAAPAAGH